MTTPADNAKSGEGGDAVGETPMAFKELRIRRNPDGSIIPFRVRTPIHKILVEMRPVTYGESQAFADRPQDANEWTPEHKAELIRDHVVGFEELTKETLLTELGEEEVSDLMLAVMFYSRPARRTAAYNVLANGGGEDGDPFGLASPKSPSNSSYTKKGTDTRDPATSTD